MTLYEDRQGRLWIGTRGGGLDRFDRAEETFVHFRHDSGDPHSLSHDVVLSTLQDGSGTMWIGTHAGLDRFDSREETFTRYRPAGVDPGQDACVVITIHEDRGGTLWIGCDKGLFRLDRAAGSFTRFSHDANDRFTCSLFELDYDPLIIGFGFGYRF